MKHDKKLVRDYYDDVASHYYEGNADSISSHMKLNIFAEVFNALDSLTLTGKKVLDLGCGPGLYGREFLKRGYEYWGVDISHEVINEARRATEELEGATVAHFMVSDIENLHMPPETFDIALAVWVLEYLNSDHNAIREIRRVLKPGGIGLVVVNNRHSYNRVIRKLALSLFGKRPLRIMASKHACQQFALRYHDPQQFRTEMEGSGFSFVQGHYFDFSMIPFNLRVPKYYFRVNEALVKLFSSMNANFPFARYLGIFRKQNPSSLEVCQK